MPIRTNIGSDREMSARRERVPSFDRIKCWCIEQLYDRFLNSVNVTLTKTLLETEVKGLQVKPRGRFSDVKVGENALSKIKVLLHVLNCLRKCVSSFAASYDDYRAQFAAESSCLVQQFKSKYRSLPATSRPKISLTHWPMTGIAHRRSELATYRILVHGVSPTIIIRITEVKPKRLVPSELICK